MILSNQQAQGGVGEQEIFYQMNPTEAELYVNYYLNS